MRVIALAAVLLMCCSPAGAAGLLVHVRAPDGAPVADAVVTVRLVGRPTPGPPPMGARTISQKDLQFHPFILVVSAGTSVAFPNLDSVRHHVYSFSPAKRFELKLFARQQNRSVLFDKPGAVAIGCNIHDQMTAYIDVVDTPWAVVTDAQGNASIAGLPAGAVSVGVWHPYLRAPGNQLTRETSAGGEESFVATLRAPPRPVGAAPY